MPAACCEHCDQVDAARVEIRYIKEKVDQVAEAVEDLGEKFVSKDAFGPVQKIAYGLVALLGGAMLTAAATQAVAALKSVSALW